MDHADAATLGVTSDVWDHLDDIAHSTARVHATARQEKARISIHDRSQVKST